MREDWCLPSVLLDLVINIACSCLCPLSVEVLRTGAPVIMVCIGLISFSHPGSLKALLVVLGLFSEGARNQIGIILYILYQCCAILQEVQHVAFP
jgi:hypothetical protein